MTLTFDPTSTAFQISNAIYMAKAAEAAYFIDTSSFTSSLEETNLKVIETIADPKDDIAWYLAKGTSYYVLAFRGTRPQDIKNWRIDFDSFQVPNLRGDDGKVHKGFCQALNGEWAAIQRADQALSPDVPLFVTGHSLGGALATLFADWACGNPSMNYAQVLYTFGAPRTGDPAFASGYRPKHFRVYREYDIVPHVPPSAFLGFLPPYYRHTGTAYMLYDKGGIGPPNVCGLGSLVMEQFAGKEAWDQVLLDHAVENDITALKLCLM